MHNTNFRALVFALLIFPIGIIYSEVSIQPASPIPEDLIEQISPIEIGIDFFEQRIAAGSKEERPLGLLLSGGSARAYAHIGVLRRLEEANIVPDFIVANSMGAIVAILYAAGFSPDDIESLITIAPLSEFFKPIFPLSGGILDSSSFINIIGELFGNTDISHLAIPLIIVCDDLLSKRQVWLAEGPLVPLFMASFSMPVYFPPVPWRGMHLVDGGTSDIIPFSVAHTFSPRIIAATALYQGLGQNYKNPITIINRNFSISKERTSLKDLQNNASFLIRCDVEAYSFMDYHHIGEIIAAGYSSTDREITSILEIFGEHPKSLDEIRKTQHENFMKIERIFLLGRRPKHFSPHFSLALDLVLPNSFNALYRLEREPKLVLKSKIGFGYTDIAAGAWTNLLEKDLGLSGNLEIETASPFKFAFGASYSGLGSWLHAEIDGRFFFGQDWRFTFGPRFEWLLDSDFQSQDLWVEGRLDLARKAPGARLQPGGHISVFYRDETAFLPVWGLESRLASSLRIIGPLELRAGALGRWSPASLRFSSFSMDPWRGPYMGSSLLPMAIANGEVALAFRNLGISLAESFQIERIDIGIYSDFLASQEAMAVVSGLSLSASMSIIGLSSLSATAFGGWDWQSSRFFWALSLGTLW